MKDAEKDVKFWLKTVQNFPIPDFSNVNTVFVK